ncbi:MAG: SHOCT domain-containing protein, partial [Planctomycetes bacterium]|nr:SHOCT domain-containing protein [Planctomycetota bacterium]
MQYSYILAKISTENMLWIGGVSALLLFGGGLAFWFIRKKLHPTEDQAQTFGVTTFTLDQIRQLHQQGQLSDDEFEKLKQKILRQTNPD